MRRFRSLGARLFLSHFLVVLVGMFTLLAAVLVIAPLIFSSLMGGMMEQMNGMMGSGMGSMMGGSMREMMGADATDEMFLEMMIPHHQMAVDMSEKALEESERPELKELARTIKDEQTAEIKLMEGYLDEIEGSTEES